MIPPGNTSAPLAPGHFRLLTTYHHDGDPGVGGPQQQAHELRPRLEHRQEFQTRETAFSYSGHWQQYGWQN